MFDCAKNEREECCKDLNDFTTKVHEEIVDAVSSLGWTMQSIESDNDNRLLCPYDSSHRIGKKILDRHLECCQWKQEGYDELDVPLPEAGTSSNSYSSVQLDSAAQNSILLEAKRKDPNMKIEHYECPTWHKLYGSGERLIPRTSDRLFTDFTRDERRVLYDYVVSNTMKTDMGDITDVQNLKSQREEHKKLSFLDLLIQERNLKRRRAKHRGVHTNKKSHTEILREVIHQQMELYNDNVTETRTTTHCENRTLDRNQDDGRNSSVMPVDEFPAKRRPLVAQESPKHCESSNSRDSQKCKAFDESYGSHAKSFERRDKRPRLAAESWETQKSYRRKRSRSREREHRDKKSKHESSRTRHHRREESRKKRNREIVE